MNIYDYLTSISDYVWIYISCGLLTTGLFHEVLHYLAYKLINPTIVCRIKKGKVFPSRIIECSGRWFSLEHILLINLLPCVILSVLSGIISYVCLVTLGIHNFWLVFIVLILNNTFSSALDIITSIKALRLGWVFQYRYSNGTNFEFRRIP